MEKTTRRLSRCISLALVLSLHTVHDTTFASTAGPMPREGLVDGATLKPTDIDAVIGNVQPGGVLIVSELHGHQQHYANQKQALAALAKANRCTVSVGLEFLAWTKQSVIAEYFSGRSIETDFLRDVEWGGNPFDDYRDQALFPRSTGGELIGLNAPALLTKAISKSGIENLSPELSALLPPAFELGNANYRERFDAVMGGHVPAAALDRYFASQSAWDDSMAWTAAEFLRANPKHCLVVIVGDFHVAWGGGLPARLAARGVGNVTVISQLETAELTDAELAAELGPHPRFGDRSDALWLSQAPL